MNISIPIDLSERVGTEVPARSVFERAMRMVYSPQSEWALITREDGGFQELFFPYTLWVVLAPAVIGALIPMTLLGVFMLFMGGSPAGLSLIFWHAAWAYGVEITALLFLGKGLSILAEKWKASTSWLIWCRVLVYGSTPYFLSAAFSWIPFFGVLFVFACAIRSLMIIHGGYRAILKQPITMSA